MKPNPEQLCPTCKCPKDWQLCTNKFHDTPPPSEPLGVAAVTPLRDSIIEIIRGVGIDVYHCTRVWSAWNVGTMDQDDFEPFNESNSPEEIADAVLALIQPATPTREPSEGATPDILDQSWTAQTLRLAAGMPDKLPERLKSMEESNADWQHRYYLEKDITLSQALRIEELSIKLAVLNKPLSPLTDGLEWPTPQTDSAARIPDHRPHGGMFEDDGTPMMRVVSVRVARSLETALAEAKARLAEVVKERDERGLILSDCADLLTLVECKCDSASLGGYTCPRCETIQAAKGFPKSSKIDALTAQLSEKEALFDQLSETNRAHLSAVNSALSTIATLRAENERLAALLQEFEDHERQTHEALEPILGKDDSLERCAIRMRDQLTAAQAQIAAKDSALREIVNDFEDSQAYVIAKRALSPSCGAELREELETLKHQVEKAKAAERIARESLAAQQQEQRLIVDMATQQLSDLTARNAKLEVDAATSADMLREVEANLISASRALGLLIEPMEWQQRKQRLDKEKFAFVFGYMGGKMTDAARQALDSAPEGRGA